MHIYTYSYSYMTAYLYLLIKYLEISGFYVQKLVVLKLYKKNQTIANYLICLQKIIAANTNLLAM